MLSLIVAIYLIGIASIIWSFMDHGAILTAIIAAVWAALLVTLKKVKLGIPAAMTASAFVLVASVVTILTYPERNDKIDLSDTKTEGSQAVEKKEVADPAGTILVDGGIGTLTKDKYDSYSYIAESARGKEAYLAAKGAIASYEFESAIAGNYKLSVKLSDDALHLDGSRSVTILLNNSKTLAYSHISKDTKGWEWFDLGQVTLIAGKNTITFTKDDTTSAAFVMDEFKFVPQN